MDFNPWKWLEDGFHRLPNGHVARRSIHSRLRLSKPVILSYVTFRFKNGRIIVESQVFRRLEAPVNRWIDMLHVNSFLASCSIACASFWYIICSNQFENGWVLQSEIGFTTSSLGGGALLSIFNLASNGKKLLLRYATVFNHWKYCTTFTTISFAYRALDREVDDEDRAHMQQKLCELGRFTGNT
jgi:hypothetical protein